MADSWIGSTPRRSLVSFLFFACFSVKSELLDVCCKEYFDNEEEIIMSMATMKFLLDKTHIEIFGTRPGLNISEKSKIALRHQTRVGRFIKDSIATKIWP